MDIEQGNKRNLTAGATSIRYGNKKDPANPTTRLGKAV